MKKIYFLFLIIIYMISIIGCVVDPPTYYFNSDELIDTVTKIELVSFVNDNPKQVTVNEDTILSFNMTNATLVKELENDKIKHFIDDLSAITFHINNESVDSPIGYAVIIYIGNQEIIVLSCTIVNDIGYSMVASFTEEGSFIKHIASFADEPKFRKFLEKYFNV